MLPTPGHAMRRSHEAMTETTTATPPVETPSGFLPDDELIFLLGRALHQAGLPAHRVESSLERTAGRLGLTVHSFCLPTGLLLSLERGDHCTTRLIRLAPRPTDLERLRRLTIE